LKALLIIAPENFKDEEYVVPKEVFEDFGITVETASTIDEDCTGKLGLTVTPDLTIASANPLKYDAIVVVGGAGSHDFLWDDDDTLDLVKNAYDAGKVVAAICISPAVLAYAGVLEGREATVFETPETIDALIDGGAKHVKGDVVADGNIVTANGPKAAQEFAEKIVELLGV